MAGSSKKRKQREQRRCATKRLRESDERISKLLSDCRQIKNLCKTKPTEHTTIMEYLRRRALRFRKSGRLEGDELEKVLGELAMDEAMAETSSPSVGVGASVSGGG